MAFLSSHLCDGHLQVLAICDGNREGSGDVYDGEESGEEHREEHNGRKIDSGVNAGELLLQMV